MSTTPQEPGQLAPGPQHLSPVATLSLAREDYLAGRRNLYDTMRKVYLNGMSANAIAAEMDGVLSRPLVLRILAESSRYAPTCDAVSGSA